MILFNIPNGEKLIETWHFFGLNTSRPVRVLFFYHRTKKNITMYTRYLPILRLSFKNALSKGDNSEADWWKGK